MRRADDGIEPARPGRQHAADDLVGDLRGGDVDHAGQKARIDQLLHRLAAGAGGVEHQAVVAVLQLLGHALHAGRRHAEHGEADGGLGLRRRGRASGVGDHAGQRVRGVRQDLLGDAVDARHVGDRIHHADVGRPDVGLHVARGHGRDHHLGHADGQRAHRRRGQRGAARAAGGDDAAEVAPRHDEALEGDAPSRSPPSRDRR